VKIQESVMTEAGKSVKNSVKKWWPFSIFDALASFTPWKEKRVIQPLLGQRVPAP